MMKRIIALLLALILTVGLLPTVALADGETVTTTANAITNPESQTAGGVTLSKTATKNDNGKYTIRLEAYARGSSTTTETTEEVPTDIILVLDRSGSMKDKMGAVKYSKYEGRQTRNDNLFNKDNLYYRLEDGSYVKVTVEKKTKEIYTAYPENTTNETYYDDNTSSGWWDDAIPLYAQTSAGNYEEVTVSRERKRPSGGGGKRHFYTYTLKNGTKIASDVKGSDTVPTFNDDVTISQVLYTKSTQNVYTYTYKDAAGQTQPITESIGDSTELRKTPMWYQWVDSDGGDSKMEALKNAASNFVDSVAKKAVGTNDGNKVEHRIAVVSFASATTNDTNGFKDMTKTDDVTAVKNAISALRADGGTLVDGGIKEANKIFDDKLIEQGTQRNRVVIVFTDGAPGLYGDWESASVSTANSAIEAANASKNTHGATVFTIGIFAGAKNDLPIPDYIKYDNYYYLSDAQKTQNSNRFMHLVSTNYPSATSIEKNPGEQNQNTGYYLTASDSASLNNVFQQISNQIQDVNTTDLDAQAKVEDVVGTNFTFAGTVASDVTIKTAPFVSETNAQYTFGTEETASATVTATVDNGKISVTGFSFKDNWCGYDKAGDTQTPHGKKLIIEFKVSENTTGCDTASIPTNNGNAKILDKDGKPAVEIGSPTVQGYRVAYDDGVDDNTVTNIPEPSKYFITSTTVVSETPTRAGYTFEGWKTAGSNTTYKAGDTITFNGQDVELIAQWTPKKQQVDLGNFVKKQFDMTEEKELANPGETFTVTVKQTKPVVESAPEYTGTATFTKGGEANFNFGTNKLTLTYGVEYEFSVVETKGQNTNISYDDESHTLTLKLKEVPGENDEKQIVADGNIVTIENSYTETYTLTYDANGVNSVVPSTSAGHKTGESVELEYKTNQPTHGPVDNKEVYLVGWSLENTNGKVYERGEALPTIAYSVTFEDSNITVYAVWAIDRDGNDTPDVYDAEATYKIVGGKWADNTTNDKIEYVPLYAKNSTTGKWTEIENPALASIPTGMTPDEGHKTPGAWDNNTTPAFVKGDTNVFSYTYTTKGKFSVIYTWTGLPADDKFAEGTKLTPPSRAEVTEGGSHDVDQTYTSESTVTDVDGNVYKFSGWNQDGTITDIQSNVTITGTWTKLGSGVFHFGDIIKKSFTAEENSNPIPYANGEKYDFYAVVKQQSGPADIEVFSSENGVTISATFDNEHQTNGAFSFYNFDEIKFTTAGEYTFRVEETSHIVRGTVNGTISDDTRQYLLTIKVDENLNVTQTYFTALPQTDGAEHMPTITFKNKYYEDPNADDVTLDLSKYVTKTFESRHGKSATESFEAKVQIWLDDVPIITNAAAEKDSIAIYAAANGEKVYDKTGTVTLSTGETKPFDFGGSITLDRNHRYRIRVTETAGSNTDVEYDKTVYETYVNFDYETKEVKWYEYNGNFSFTNTYTGIDDYYPIIIPTIINKDTGMLNKTDHFAYVIGYPDGTVHPNGQITRAEVATIFFRLLRDEVRDGAFTTSNTYSDVAYGKWYNNPISTMSALGIITGYPDGTFKPNKPITRAEFAAIAARFDETQSGKSATFSDVIGHWAAKEIGIAYYNDWIKGYPDGTFKPDQNITRAEAMTLINRVLERKPESPADLLTNMNKWTDNMDTSKWYYLDVQEATNSHGYTRKTFNYELWRQMLPDPDWSRYER